MALSTYSDLKSAIADWLARDDITDARLTDFVTLFEAVANRRLRVRQMETTTSLTPSSGSASLPSDYLQWRRVTSEQSTPVTLEYAAPEWLRSAYPTTDSGTPKYFTIEGSSIVIRPADTTSLTLHYYEKIDALSGTVNWLYSAHPDLYLFGSLVEARMFTQDAERAALWKARRDELFEEIERLSNKSRGAGSVRPAGTVV